MKLTDDEEEERKLNSSVVKFLKFFLKGKRKLWERNKLIKNLTKGRSTERKRKKKIIRVESGHHEKCNIKQKTSVRMQLCCWRKY